MTKFEPYVISNPDDTNVIIDHMHNACHTDVIELPSYNIYNHRDEDGVLISYDILHKE